MKNKKRNESGFTLVELLVVITIIAILVGLVIPVIMSSRQKSTNLKCLGQLREWGHAYTAYLAEQENLYPTGSWFTALAPYVGYQKMWEPGGVRPKPGDETLYTCPSSTPGDFSAASPLKIGYAMNDLIHVSGRSSGPIGVPTINRSMIGKPSGLAVLFDSKSTTGYGNSADLLLRHARNSQGNILFADGSAATVTNRLKSSGRTILWDPADAL